MSEDYRGDPAIFGDDGCMFSEEAVTLRDCFRLLWEQHVYWTRMVILGIAFDLPDLELTTNRLLRNATIEKEALMMADDFSNGITCQFNL